jgi:hypothetical protein
LPDHNQQDDFVIGRKRLAVPANRYSINVKSATVVSDLKDAPGGYEGDYQLAIISWRLSVGKRTFVGWNRHGRD